MKRLAVLTCWVVLAFVANTVAADTVADLSGEWQLDSSKSDPAPIPIVSLGAPEGGRGGGGGGFGGGMGGPGGGFPGAKPQPPSNVPMVIKQTATEIQITTAIGNMPAVESYRLDTDDEIEETVPPAPNSQEPGKKRTKVSLKKDSLTVQQTTKYPKSESGFKKSYSLSKNGKTLTVKIKTTSQFGMMINQTEQKLVYNKVR